MTHDLRDARRNRMMWPLSRRSFLQWSGLAIGALGGIGLFGGCREEEAEAPEGVIGDATTPAESGAAGQITYTSTRGLTTLNPLLVETSEEIALIQLITEPLVRLDTDMELVPALATSWEPLDPTTWQFKLREGVSFHNGEPFNAEVVKFTFDEYHRIAEEFPWFYIWGDELPQVEVIDDSTVNFVSSSPIAATPRNLVLMFMLPPEAASESDFVDNLVGTGPYKFVEHRRDIRLELEANAEYWGGAPAVQTLEYRPIPDPSARLTAAQTGEVDVAANIPPDLVPTLQQSAELQVFQIPGVRLAHYPFNFRNTESPIADVRVRRAFGYAINGQSIIQDVLAGAAHPLQGPVSSTLFAAADLGGYPEYDPDQARALLAEAGYPEDYELTLIYTEGEFIKDREVTEAIQAMLTDAGVRVTIETLESGAYGDRRSGPDWDIALNGFSAVNGDPGFFLAWATGPSFGYENSDTEQAIAQALQTVDEDEQTELLRQAQEFYWEDVPYLWGYTQTDTVAMRNRIQGIQPLPNGWIPFHEATLSD